MAFVGRTNKEKDGTEGVTASKSSEAACLPRVVQVRRRSDPELILGCELAQNLQKGFGLFGGMYEGGFAGRW